MCRLARKKKDGASRIEPTSGQSRTLETGEAFLTYSVADQLVDGTDTENIFVITVAQLGVFAKSDPPARITFDL
jgi:hypothetical protein